MESAADNGDLEMLTYLHKYGSLGHFPKWLKFIPTLGGFYFNSEVPWSDAQKARIDHLAVATFIYENELVISDFELSINEAAVSGHLNVLQFLHETGEDYWWESVRAMDGAASEARSTLSGSFTRTAPRAVRQKRWTTPLRPATSQSSSFSTRTAPRAVPPPPWTRLPDAGASTLSSFFTRIGPKGAPLTP